MTCPQCKSTMVLTAYGPDDPAPQWECLACELCLPAHSPPAPEE